MVRTLAHLALDPFLQFWLLISLAAIFRWRKRGKTSRTLALSALAWLFLISISPLPTWFVKRWEKPFAQPLLTLHANSPRYIVVLGGGHTYAPTLPPGMQLSDQALERLSEGIRLYRQEPGRILCLSGYGKEDQPAQAELLALAAVELGVSPADTLINPIPVNTEAEAFTLAQRLPGTGSILLVTHAIHMRRALFWFRQAGFDPIPAPCDLEVKPEPGRSPYNFWPSTQKIDLTRKLFHEWVGMLWAHWQT